MLTVQTAEVPGKTSPNSQRRRSADLLLSLSGYGSVRARRPPTSEGSPDDDSILRSHSFSSVSLLHNRVTATAAIPAVPAISILREMSPLPETSDVPAIPDLSTVTSTPPKKTDKSSLGSKSRHPGSPGRSIFDYPDNDELTRKSSNEMPKKSSTSSGDRRTATKIFRSVSALSSRKNKENNGKDGRERASSGISDSDRNDGVLDRASTNADGKNDHQQKGDNFQIELREMNSKLHEMTAKLHEAELENDNLKSLIGASYKGSINPPIDEGDSNEIASNSKGQHRTVVYQVEDHSNESVIEASGYAVHLNHSNHCKECEKLKETTIKALVESIALRKYTRQLSEALSGDDQAKKNILKVLENKLISSQTEKEIALEELAHVIEQRDQIVSERDRALEEWGKAATKWESTLDQVDSLMKELNKVKSSREDMVFQIEKAESRMKQEMDSREKLLEDFAELNEHLNTTQRERVDSVSEHEKVTRHRFEREQELQKTKTELAKAQQRCLELDAKLTSLGDKFESCKKEKDHAKEQWRHSVKERKKLHREMAAIVLARDEAIQKCFSTAEKLDKLKEDYNRLLNRLARTGLGTSDTGSTCSSRDCHFCSSQDSSGSFEDVQRPDGKEVTTILGKEDPLESIKVGRVTCHARAFTGIMDIDRALGAAKNVRKYDEIISINDIPVSESDQNLVRSLLDGATSDIKLILRRPVNNCLYTFDVEMKMPKKAKSGYGFDCGLYVKGTSIEQRTLDVGDYIHKINGKHLDKILSSSVDKVIKKSTEKVKFHITRTIKSSHHTHDVAGGESDKVVLRRLPGITSKTSNDVNRLSIISNDSSISMRSRDSRLSGASSLGSMASNNDSCFADSSSDHSGPIHSTPFGLTERPRIATAIYVPSDEQLDEHPHYTELLTTDGKDSDDLRRLKAMSQMGRKYNSTTILRPGGYDSSGSDYGLTRTQSTIAATRIDEEERWDVGLGRTGTVEILAPASDRVRVMRLEKEMFQSLGLEVSGGNLVGIYVKELTDDSVCKIAGLVVGDRLIKLNCYDFTRTTLDHATRIVRLLNSCTYVRIEAESGDNYKDVLKQTPHDSIYVRTISFYKAMSPDELSFTVGETLHIINTRANYDKAKQSWKWVAMRKDGKNIDEGLVPCMGSLPDEVETAITASQVIAKLDAESVEDLGSDDGGATMKRGGSERRSFLQRYRKMRKRDSREPFGSGMDVNGNSGKVTFYEILSKLR